MVGDAGSTGYQRVGWRESVSKQEERGFKQDESSIEPEQAVELLESNASKDLVPRPLRFLLQPRYASRSTILLLRRTSLATNQTREERTHPSSSSAKPSQPTRDPTPHLPTLSTIPRDLQS